MKPATDSCRFEFYLEYPSHWTANQAAIHYLKLLGAPAAGWAVHVHGTVWGDRTHLTRYRCTGAAAPVTALEAAHRAHQQLTGREFPKLSD